MYRYVCEVYPVINSTTRNTALPSLPLPGAAMLFGALLLLSCLSVHAGGFFILTAAVSGAFLAVLLLFHRSILTLFIPLACALLIAFQAPNVLSAVPAFAFLPAGVSIAFSLRLGKSRMAAIAITSVSVGFVLAAAGAVLLVVQRISLSDFLLSLRTSLTEALTSFTVVTADAGEMPLFTEESAAALVTYATLLAPAIAACSLFLVSYIATVIVRRMLIGMKADTFFFKDGWRMMPTKGMTVLYIGSQIFTFLFAAVQDTQALYYGCYNLSLIFLMPLSILGLTTLVSQFRRSESLGVSSRLALLFLALMIAAAGLYWFLTFAAFYGIYIVFRRENAAS